MTNFNKTNPISALLCDKELRAKYDKQKRGAGYRGIEWHFTWQSWLYMWLASGKLEQRGRKAHEYCMSRIGDRGAYSPDNVRIVTNSDNARENGKRERSLQEIRQFMRNSARPNPVIVYGTRYKSFHAAAKALGGINPRSVQQRVDSDNFPDWVRA